MSTIFTTSVNRSLDKRCVSRGRQLSLYTKDELLQFIEGIINGSGDTELNMTTIKELSKSDLCQTISNLRDKYPDNEVCQKMQPGEDGKLRYFRN